MAFGPFFVGEKIPFALTLTDKNTGSPVDLTGYTNVKVMLRKDGAATNRFTVPSEENATVRAPATAGIIDYTMPAAWADADDGRWHIQAQVTTPASLTRKSEKISFKVEPAIAPSP